ncbi:helix-turn-helix transcriptional regulator [Marinicella sp. S1101]|nr:helix-turn-helix transcriptional regulator [Marinicella marina]MCX7555147.1 helix-turn-helix transcriptional regulator [Marinicella marina]MDJ1141412.1 helix-turn-helix transcriptional regulator [Marinicella marina]
MLFESMNDAAVAAEIGQRIRQLRLEKNLTQQQVADEVGLSRLSYRRLETGEAKFVNVIAVLRFLGGLEALNQAIPETVFSPIEQLKLQGRKRQRASSKRQDENAQSKSLDDQGW